VLLRLAVREAASSEQSDSLCVTSDAVRRVTGSLDRRGLIRRRFERQLARFVFGITSSGLRALRPLVPGIGETGLTAKSGLWC
jgi:DNA-binding MarR family transcriptional regulator